MSMRSRIIAIVLAVLLGSTGCGKVAIGEPIKVGVLFSMTGAMAPLETSVKDATLMAIGEINSRGGVLGRKIEPVIADGKSDWATFAAEAERLITKEKVSVVFGGWTSESRKALKPLFEKYNHLLIYPVQYEGLEQSPNIIYTGAAPNQQIIPAVKWCFDKGWKRLFLVGSDYLFSHAAHEIIKAQANALGGEIVGEDYLLPGARDVANVIQKILALKPDVILNTLTGDTNVAFFGELRRAGVTPDRIPTLSFSLAEQELAGMDPKTVAGNYGSRNYFQSITTEENKVFVEAFKKKYGKERVIDDPVEAGYFGVYLWAQAVEDAATDDVNAVRKAIQGQSFLAPEGIVYVDPETRHTWKTVRIGVIREDGQFTIVWTSGKPVRPVPYPLSKLKAEWEKFMEDLFQSWGQKWANPRR
jgi:urea transport system substrate-binding protein